MKEPEEKLKRRNDSLLAVMKDIMEQKMPKGRMYPRGIFLIVQHNKQFSAKKEEDDYALWICSRINQKPE